jgi:hypothetical protein
METVGEINTKIPPFKRQNIQGFTPEILGANQPYLIRKSFFDLASDWRADQDLAAAGADNIIFLEMEKVSRIHQVNEVLYYRRLHRKNTSLTFETEKAHKHTQKLIDLQIN